MRLLANPVFLRILATVIVTFAAMAVFLIALRALRKMILPEGEGARVDTARDVDFAAAAFQGVLQHYKNQEKALNQQRESERQSALAQETMTSALLKLLPVGVLVFNKVGLVQQANPAAKEMLGYASPLNFHLRDVFKGVEDAEGTIPALIEAFEKCKNEGAKQSRLQSDYATPQGERRKLLITLAAAHDEKGALLGVLGLIEEARNVSEAIPSQQGTSEES